MVLGVCEVTQIRGANQRNRSKSKIHPSICPSIRHPSIYICIFYCLSSVRSQGPALHNTQLLIIKKMQLVGKQLQVWIISWYFTFYWCNQVLCKSMQVEYNKFMCLLFTFKVIILFHSTVNQWNQRRGTKLSFVSFNDWSIVCPSLDRVVVTKDTQNLTV